ncbi:hypothetical protein ABQF29_22560, partial [Mycolicibacter minnesotensis]
AGSAVGAFLAFGLSPLSSAPVAHADELDWVVDLVGSDLAGALGDLSQASSWETLFDQASWEPLLSNVGLSFDASLAGVPGSAAADDWFGSLFYDPWHDLGQAWINSSFGSAVNDFINIFGFGQILIGNGADGIDGGTLAQAAGGAGGLWFGDGGAGGTSADGIGGVGGSAG